MRFCLAWALAIAAVSAGVRADEGRAALAPRAFPNCTFAGLGVGNWGAERLASYVDAAGRGVEVWCLRGMFSAHYDLRVTWNEPDGAHGAMVRRVKSVAGCYFVKGENTGPDIAEDPAGVFTRVTWTNANPRDKGAGYAFSFDWTTGKLTITATASGKAPAVRVVDPPDDYDALDRLLPEP